MKSKRVDGCYDGYLLARLHAIGTRSEGPQYYLQRWDYREERIIKSSDRDEEDVQLHSLIGKKVRLRGRRTTDGISYHEIETYDLLFECDYNDESELDVFLEFQDNKIYVNQHIPLNNESRVLQYFDMTLHVAWKGSRFWKGTCPTSQVYDFSIWHDSKEIWRWSDGKFFPDAITPVIIPSDDPARYLETWYFLPGNIEKEGTHKVRATFLASGDSCEREFEVRFL